METLKNKIDFAVILKVNKANPNGDPLNGNRPRIDFDGYGEISDVCLKRKIRNCLMNLDENVLVQSDDNKKDDSKSIKDRIIKSGILGAADFAQKACENWYDVRAFGQVFAFKGKEKDKGVSIALRGPVSVHSAFSIEPIRIESVQITKSVNNETGDKEGKSSDTMGMKHRVNNGIYVFYGSINPQLAQKTNYSDKDAETLKSILPRLFENDESSARPAGTMQVLNAFWWNHGCPSGKYSSAKVHQSLKVNADGTYELIKLGDLAPEILEGF